MTIALGRLTILQARMNPDLAMGDELLKKTGTGNLFMVFGEPDVDVREVGANVKRKQDHRDGVKQDHLDMAWTWVG